MRAWFGLLAILLFSGALHLAAPNRSAHLHAAAVGPVTYAFNADSAAFARIVVRFPEGFTETEAGRERILRPLYPALGRLAYTALRPLADRIPDAWLAGAGSLVTQATHRDWWAGIDLREIAAAWAGLVAVNLLLLWGGALLAHAAFSTLWPGAQAFWMTALLLVHFDVVDFVLVPHTEPFNLLVPALALWCIVRRIPETRVAGVLGFLMLGKGIAFPLVNFLRPGPKKTTAALCWFALPGIAYLLFLACAGLPAYNHETSGYRQFVWMLDEALAGNWGGIPARWAVGTLEETVNVAKGLWIPLAGAAWLLARPCRAIPALPEGLARQAGLYATACLAFWVLAGYHAPRLSILYFPPVWILLGTGLARGTSAPGCWGAGLFAAQFAGIVLGLFRY